MKNTLLLFISIIAIVFNLNAHATNTSERIEQFESAITVNPDASIDVTENISVYANQDRIIHGIVRRLPIRYTDSYGIDRRTNYVNIETTLNGNAVDYHTKKADNQLEIYIGSADITLAPGNYTYGIHYHVNDAINFLRDGDELYWNITGNNWDFTIEHAAAIIQLPEHANISTFAGYTGIKGTRGRNFIAHKIGQNKIEFATTTALPSEEGLTIAVAWQKGIIHQLSWWEWFIQQFYTIEFVILELALLIFIYYFYIWYAYGRGPAQGTIVPLFTPPENLTPEAMRYILRMSYDDKIFSAAIVNLAANGYLTIENKDGVFTLKKIVGTNKPIAQEEKMLAGQLFSGGAATVIINESSFKKVKEARTQLKKNLAASYQDKYFVTNRRYLVPGWIMSALVLLCAVWFADDRDSAITAVIWLSGWTFGCVILLMRAFAAIQIARATRSITKIMGAIFSSLFTIPFLVGEMLGIYYLSAAIPIFTVPVLLLLVVLNILFFYILKAPTVAGRQLMDKIQGFKLFFVTTERYRLAQFKDVKNIPALFEKYLPYAIALDMENEWSAQFEEVLRAAGIEPTTYHPTWYSGSGSSLRSISMLPAALGAGLASSLASASTSNSSSASGGGGSSGGGGGGGGGGGW